MVSSYKFVMRNDLQMVRGVAALLVVFYHVWVQTSGHVNDWFSGSVVGVDIFFVMSGFLITSLLLREFDTAGRISLKQFYARRIKRIMPAATLVILVAVSISALMFKQSGLPFFKEAFWTGLFSLNWYYIFNDNNYFEASSTTGFTHFWSLAVEEQFYVVWPLLVIAGVSLFIKFGIRRYLNVILAVIVVSSLSVHVVTTLTDSSSAYYNTFGRAWELGVGALVAVNSERLYNVSVRFGKRLGYVGFVLAFSPLMFFNEHSVSVPLWPMPAVLGTALVAIAALDYTHVESSNFWNNRFLVWIGRISFSFYLWHAVILITVVWLIGGELSAQGALFVFGLSVLFGWLSTEYFEEPIRRSRWLEGGNFYGFSRTHVLGVVMLGFVLVITSCLFMFAKTSPVDGAKVSLYSIQNSIEESLKPGVDRSYNNRVYPQPPVLGYDWADTFEDGCFHQYYEAYTPDDAIPCVYGDENSEETVIVFGDSQVAMWMNNFDRWGEENDVKVKAWTKSACPAYDVIPYLLETGGAYLTCDKWRDAALEEIKQSSAGTVFIGGGLFLSHADSSGGLSKNSSQREAEILSGYGRVISTIKASGKNVVVLGPIPNAFFKMEDIIRLRDLDSNLVSEQIGFGLYGNLLNTSKKVAADNNSGFIDFTDMFCNATVCPVIIDGLMVYMDSTHVSKTYADYTYNLFTEKVSKASGGYNF